MSIVPRIDEIDNPEWSKGSWLHYLVRFLCAEFNISGMNIAITNSPHSHRRLRQWLVRFVCMDLVLREVRKG